jgi:hypothetical protein
MNRDESRRSHRMAWHGIMLRNLAGWFAHPTAPVWTADLQ